jgi:Mn2+/Fe2+ NRAMP family transporter
MGKSRDVTDTVVRALAKVGLVWALAVLAGLFMIMGAQGQHESDGPAAQADSVTVTDSTPRLAGIALAVFILASGVTVLVMGSVRGERESEDSTAGSEESDLSLALGLGLLA